MRILEMSDIHLEFGPFSLPDDITDFDVAVFAGDISRPISSAIEWIDIQRRSALKGRPAIFVPGNHEFYGTEIGAALREGKALAQTAGIHLLAPGAVIIGGARFVGGTLWTDYNLLGDARSARRAALSGMNDHRRITVVEAGRRMPFRPVHALSLHRQDLAFITQTLEEPFDGPTVVATHHAPHSKSVQPQYEGDPLSPAFASDLCNVIERYQPALWIHGHDHGSHDYRVGLTRVVSNQAGYPKGEGARENPRFDPRLVLDLVTSSR